MILLTCAGVPAVRIDRFDARAADDAPGCVEVGLFAGEECRGVVPIAVEDALELRQALTEAIAGSILRGPRRARGAEPRTD